MRLPHGSPVASIGSNLHALRLSLHLVIAAGGAVGGRPNGTLTDLPFLTQVDIPIMEKSAFSKY